MSLTITEARDEILSLFATAWGSETPIYYWDVAHNAPTSGSWVRVIVRHNLGSNDAITNRLFTRLGIVTVQLFTVFGQGLTENDRLTKIALDTFQGKATPGGVWFRNVRPNEIGPDGHWFQTNILADFEYTERV